MVAVQGEECGGCGAVLVKIIPYLATIIFFRLLEPYVGRCFRGSPPRLSTVTTIDGLRFARWEIPSGTERFGNRRSFPLSCPV